MPAISLYYLDITQLLDELFHAGSKVIISEGVESIVDEKQDDGLNNEGDTDIKMSRMKDWLS